MTAPAFRVIDPEGLPDYPAELIGVPPGTDYFLRLYHTRWLNSHLHIHGSMAVQGMALNLYFIARQQNPMGSLPVCHETLARFLRVDQREWDRAMSEKVTPLHGWREYALPDGAVVLGHEVVIAEALDAINRREARAATNTEKAAAARINRLGQMLRDMGPEYVAIAQDQGLLVKLDEWLLRHHPGQRRQPQITTSINRGLRAGQQEGWFKG